MITAEDYRKDPCGAFSLPYWKAKSIAIPTHMQIVREDQLDGTRLDAYMDDPYFKLCHYFDGVKKPMCPRGFELVLSTPELLSRHIAQCYEYERLSVSELQEMQSHFTYCPGLWISVADEASGEVAATGIAGIDPEIGEGTLEWIQVSPRFRRQGLGEFLVKELLYLMKDKADFATVSGRVNNRTQPERLYEKCGFQDEVIWHILSQKSDID